MDARPPLNARQQLFVAEYLRCRNATEAARLAGYSPRTARQAGTENLAKPAIAAAIAAGQAAALDRAELAADVLLAEVDNLAMSDIGDILDFSGAELKLRPARDIPAAARRCISSFKVKRYFEGAGDEAREVEVVEFKLWSKPEAQRLALLRRGLLKDSAGGPAVSVQVVIGVDEAKLLGTAPAQEPARGKPQPR